MAIEETPAIRPLTQGCLKSRVKTSVIVMERCAFCKAEETMLFENGAPICIKCDAASPEERKVRITLYRHMHEAVARAEAATDAFTAMASNIPSGIPHPDGVQRIRNASREMTAARNKMMEANARLNDYLERGIVPEDLKQNRSL
jgi:hypothetical protein